MISFRKRQFEVGDRFRRWLPLLCAGVLLLQFAGSQIAAAEPGLRPATVYRSDDNRPLRDDALAASLGIKKYVSRHLILYTDISPEIAVTLPPLIDQIYPVWIKYFGELPPARDGSDFQMTCYLMQDQGRFAEAGMQAEGVMLTRFGRQIGREFWMLEQQGDYYRRHLLFHEATHAFMTTVPRVLPPLWYLEGMAELFATHTIDGQGRVTFGVFPQASTVVPEWGRIEIIRQELFHKRPVTLQQIGAFANEQFAKPRPVPYAWSWAVCSFLEQHPRYHDRFRHLAQDLEHSAFQRMMGELFEPDRRLLAAEWDEYVRRLDYGIDVPSSAFQPMVSRAWPADDELEIEIPARLGWQSTGLHVDSGVKVSIQVTGRVQLSPGSPALVSEPQGISLAYAAGYPIGALLAGCLPLQSTLEKGQEAQLEVTAVGANSILTPTRSSELWLRVNDTGSGLKGNEGSFRVVLKKVRD